MPTKNTSDTLKQEQKEYYESKNKWLAIAEKIVLPILGFVCVWIFNSINELKAEYAKIVDAEVVDRIASLEKREEAVNSKLEEMSAMWRVIKSYEDKINANKVQSQVNALVNDKFTKVVMSQIAPESTTKKFLNKVWPSKDPHDQKKELILEKFGESLEKDYKQYKEEKLRDFNQEQMQRKK
jgi:hypothetical protein